MPGQLEPEVGPGQAVDEEIYAVLAEEDRLRDVFPASGRVEFFHVCGSLQRWDRLLQLAHEVITPRDEIRNVQSDEGAGHDQ